jgi:hypothetical protein
MLYPLLGCVCVKETLLPPPPAGCLRKETLYADSRYGVLVTSYPPPVSPPVVCVKETLYVDSRYGVLVTPFVNISGPEITISCIYRDQRYLSALYAASGSGGGGGRHKKRNREREMRDEGTRTLRHRKSGKETEETRQREMRREGERQSDAEKEEKKDKKDKKI